MPLPDPQGPPYTKRVKPPRYNRSVSIVEAAIDGHPAYMRRAFPTWDKPMHRDAAYHWAREAGRAGRAYDRLSLGALDTYGSHGALVSGVVRGHFPDRVKESLRYMLARFAAVKDASVAHWFASGSRTRYRDTELARLVGSAGHYGFHF